MKRTLVMLLVAGCGRVGFSARANADASTDASSDGGDGSMATVCHTGTWSTPALVTATQTSSEEADPSLSADGLTLYFESNRVGSQSRAIWRTTRAVATGSFGMPELVGEIDNALDDRDPEIAADGLSIFYMTKLGMNDTIATGTRATPAGAFGNAATLVINGDTAQAMNCPELSPDGLTLYYAHDLELAVATRPSVVAPFTFVRELDEVNAPATDSDPTVTGDGLELFFSSYRTGPSAIFRATRSSSTGLFTGLAEVPELAGPAGAGAPEITADGRTLYFWQSDGTQLDLYTSTRTCN